MFMLLAIRDWTRRRQPGNLGSAVMVGLGEEEDNPTITAREAAAIIERVQGYAVDIVFDVHGHPLPLAPDTVLDHDGPRTLYFKRLD